LINQLSSSSYYNKILEERYKRYFITNTVPDDPIKEATNRYNTVKREIDSIESFLKIDDKMIEILNLLVSNFPYDANFDLNNLVINESIIRLDGTINSTAKIDEFKNRLLQTQKFESVVFNTNVTQNNVKFSMTIKFKSNKPKRQTTVNEEYIMIKLSNREKLLLKILIGTLVLIIGYNFIVMPLKNFFSSSDTVIISDKQKIEQLDRIYNNYKELETKRNQYMSLLRSDSENISTMIEQWAQNSNIARNISYSRRNQTNVQNKYIRITTDMKLDGVSIQSLLRFIYEIENSNKLVNISYLRINKSYKSPNLYDVNLKIESYTLQ
jgi:hypothetical protein